jgi:hypothetical protein
MRAHNAGFLYNELSGTWRWMSGTRAINCGGGVAMIGIAVRVA